MAKIYHFPNKGRNPTDVALIDMLKRALSLNDYFLSIALGRDTFIKKPEEQDAVLDLMAVNANLLSEVRKNHDK